MEFCLFTRSCVWLLVGLGVAVMPSCKRHDGVPGSSSASPSGTSAAAPATTERGTVGSASSASPRRPNTELLPELLAAKPAAWTPAFQAEVRLAHEDPAKIDVLLELDLLDHCPAVKKLRDDEEAGKVKLKDEFDREQYRGQKAKAQKECIQSLAAKTKDLPKSAVVRLAVEAHGDYDFNAHAFWLRTAGAPDDDRFGSYSRTDTTIILSKPRFASGVGECRFGVTGPLYLVGLAGKQFVVGDPRTKDLHENVPFFQLPATEADGKKMRERLDKEKEGLSVEILFVPDRFRPTPIGCQFAENGRLKLGPAASLDGDKPGVVGHAVAYRVTGKDGKEPLTGWTPFAS